LEYIQVILKGFRVESSLGRVGLLGSSRKNFESLLVNGLQTRVNIQ